MAAVFPQMPKQFLSKEQYEPLLQSIEAISGELRVQPLLTLILEQVCRLVGAQGGVIGQVNRQQDCVCAEAIQGAALAPCGVEFRIENAPGGNILAQVLALRESLSAEQYRAIHPQASADVAEWAVAGVPVWAHGKLLAIWAVAAPRRFDNTAVALLEAFARHAGRALAIAQRFEAEQQRSAREVILSRVGRLISSSLSLDAILQNTVHSITDELPAVTVGVLLVDPDDPEWLVLRASGGLHASQPVPVYSQRVSAGVIGAAAQSQQPVLVPDVHREPRYISFDAGQRVRSELAVPIVAGTRLLGVLNIESEQVIDVEEVDDFKLVADQLAVAIEHANLFAATQRALEEAKLLYDTSQRISVGQDVNEVIRAYLDQVAARQRYACSIVLYEFDAEGRRNAVIMRGRWALGEGVQCPLAVRIPYTRDGLDPPLDRGETVRIADVHSDPRCSEELRRLQEQDHRPALVLIPLMVRSRRIGLVILSYSQVHTWREDELRPYQITAAQLATTIDSRMQQALLAGHNQRLAIWEERRRLARELHDSVTQLIFSMTLIAQSLAAAWRREPAEGERRTQRLLELSQNALGEMRALLRELRPPEAPAPRDTTLLDIVPASPRDLVSALQVHVEGMKRDGLHVELDTEGYRFLEPENEHTLFRIAQEALHNVVKHAGASRVWVRLASADDETRLSIQDDGIGFALSAGASGGMGLQTMRERAESLGGVFSVTSTPGAGTIVEVVLDRARTPVNAEGSSTL
jgi:signal transduction histidine kinase